MEVKLDQHFMDAKYAKKVVDLARITKSDTVLEIGPGKGVLTELLAGRAKKVIAVEIDPSFEGYPENVESVPGNALGLMRKIAFTKVVSNLPYSICEAFLNQLTYCSFKSAVVTVPEIFAGRLQAKKGPLCSKLSLMASWFFSIKRGPKIPRSAFDPEPDTDSVVIVIRPTKRTSRQELFLQKDKKLKNILLSLPGRTKNQARQMLEKMCVTPELLDKKPQNLSLEETLQAETILKKLFR